jgi:hypothetical protein
MSNDELIPTQSTDVDDIDDVEGHGLKEVVVGLSAAAVLGGGVASAASSIPPIGDGLKTPGAVMSVVQGAQDDVTKVTSPTLKGVERTADGATTTVDRTADRATDAAVDTATDAVRTVDGIAADAITGLRPVLDDPDRYAIDTARSVANPTMSTVNATAKTATDTATSTVRTADGLAADTLTAADATAKWGLRVIDATTKATGDRATTIVLGLQGSDADFGGSAASKDAWVVAKVGDEVIAKSDCDNGTWTLTIESKHLDSPITFSLGGDDTDPATAAPLTVHLSR